MKEIWAKFFASTRPFSASSSSRHRPRLLAQTVRSPPRRPPSFGWDTEDQRTASWDCR